MENTTDKQSVKPKMGFQIHPENINRAGRPKRKTLTEIIHAKLDASIDENWDTLAELVLAKIFKTKDKELLLSLWDRTDGKPKQIVELDDTTEKISLMKEYVDNKIQSMDGAVSQEPDRGGVQDDGGAA